MPQDADTRPADARIADAQAPDARTRALQRIFDLLRLVVIGTVVILAVWLLSDVLTVVFAAALLAVILHGVAMLLHRYARLPYWAALAVTVVVIVAALGALVAMAGPGIVTQAAALQKALVTQWGALHDRMQQSNWGRLLLQQVPASLGGEKEGGGMPSVPGSVAGSVAGFLGSAFGLSGTLAVVVIAGIYLAADPGIYVNGALRLFPVHYRPQAKELVETAGKALWAWSAGQALDMLVVAILSALGLWLIGVPLALALGVLAGLMNFVPYIGAIIGAVPAVIIAFSVGSTQGFETIGLYLVIQGFEGNVMAPMIQNRAAHLPPGLTILAQTAFGAILGIPGFIFATPLTAALLAVLNKATPKLDPEEKV